MIRKYAQMKYARLENCHAGKGVLHVHHLLGPGDSGMGIAFMHDDLLPPGASIGAHSHENEEEVYFVVEGGGTMHLDGREYPVGRGDICVCRPGHTHGLVNSGELPMRLLVIGLKPVTTRPQLLPVSAHGLYQDKT